MSAFSNIFSRLLGRPAESRAQLAAAETENYFTLGARNWGSEERDRYDFDREEMLRQALEAWRVNPIARRIVELTTQYVVGAGLRVQSTHKDTHKFIEDWWNHRLNQLPMRVYEWCDELTRSGEIFLLVSTDAAGMSYVRGVPAADIEVDRHRRQRHPARTAICAKGAGPRRGAGDLARL